MADTASLALPLLAAAQAQKHITHNEALILLDAVAQIAVRAIDQNAPPASPVAGDRYLVGSTPTGAFAGQAAKIAAYDGSAWRFMTPKAGWVMTNTTDSSVSFHDGLAWRNIAFAIKKLDNLTGLGVGTASDANNPLAVKVNDALFAARGTGESGTGDLRFKLNKEATAKTVSQLYQTNYSGRAEAGLIGDDSWRLKVSSDGSIWRDALVAAPATGAVRMDMILSGRATQGNTGRIECDFASSGAVGMVLTDTGAAASATALALRKNNAQVGAITLSTTGATYSTTSDYRLKQDVTPIEDGLARVVALKPCRFAFKVEPDQRVDGFIAHEMAEVVPEAVTGVKDGANEEGLPVYQAVDAGRIIPILVSAVQELARRVAELEARA
jgi:hypothetical protein